MAGNATDGIFCVAETASGKVRGIINAGVCQFKAIPYGAPTGGCNRFAPPKKPDGWTGVRDCFAYGEVAPQVPIPVTNAYGRLIHFDLVTAAGGMGENCLHLNIWTPSLEADESRPVLVSLHGGGFAIASGNVALYDGAELARRDNVVVVTVTHRLASFGYLDLAAFGLPDEFRYAGVAGILDLVAALEWVRDNIGNFGGDPGCVTIFGQSGGGWKVSTLLAAPAAKGLFHRAVVQSGSLLQHMPRAVAAVAAETLIGKLGLRKNDLANIQQVSWQEMLAAQAAVGAHMFAPVVDAAILPHDPFDPVAPEESADIPLIVSTTLDDASFLLDNFDIDRNGLEGLIGARYGEKAGAMLRLYTEKWPELSPYLLQARLITDAGFRRFAHAQAERKARQARAPVYTYRWDWPCPGYGGKFGAVHGIDVPASLANAREAMVGAGSQPGRSLCDQLSSALTAFARTGNPNNARLPEWPAYQIADRATMILDDPPHVVIDPDADLRAFWSAMPPALSVLG